MATIDLEVLQRDRLAMSVALAVSAANVAALQQGVDPMQSLVAITEDSSPEGRAWRVQYGPREYIGRRGGDLIVLVDERSGTVRHIIRGQ